MELRVLGAGGEQLGGGAGPRGRPAQHHQPRGRDPAAVPGPGPGQPVRGQPGPAWWVGTIKIFGVDRKYLYLRR